MLKYAEKMRELKINFVKSKKMFELILAVKI